MFSALITLLAALSLAGVAGWFSIVGITSIYAGAPMHAALIMGIVLELAKLVTVSWIYRNWKFINWSLKTPLIYATIALMVATSISVFGFLTKAHLEQGAATIDNTAKIERLDQQITREKSTIIDDERVISQLDATIASFIGKDNADRALSVRKSQLQQRKQLRDEIDAAHKRISNFSDEKLKLTSEVRALQLEVGPIRYISELIYSNEDNETKKVESAVKLFTLLIVSTLDPLAIILLVAANHTLLRLENEKKKPALFPQEERQTTNYNTENNNSFRNSTIKETIQNHYNVDSNIEFKENISTYGDIINAEQEDSTLSKTVLQEVAKSTKVLSKVDVDNTAIYQPIHEKEEILEKPTIQNNSIFNISGIPSNQNVPVLGEESAIFKGSDTELPEEIQEIKLTMPSDVITHVTAPISLSDLGNNDINTATNIELTNDSHDTQNPWAHQSLVLNGILGTPPHFVPQKLNVEKNKNIVNELNTPVIKNVPDKIHDHTHNTTVEIQDKIEKLSVSDAVTRLTSTGPTLDKYPKTLSWINEFKKD